MSKINIDRIVKDIRTRSTSLTPIIEAVCNSIDAIDPSRTDGKIDIIIKRDSQLSMDLDNDKIMPDIIGVDVIDNGEGFTTANRDSFDTFRSGLKSNKGGKGFGRFMYLKYFNHVEVESIFKNEQSGELNLRTFTFGHNDEILENEHTTRLSSQDAVSTGTTLHLSSIKTKDLDKGLDVIARKLVERLLAFFAVGGTHVPIITIKEEDGSNSIILNDYVGPESSIQQIGETKKITITGKNRKSHDFTVKVYKIYYSAITNKICLTANMREVTESTLHAFVPEFKETMSEIDEKGIQRNYMVKVYVQGEYLDENVSTDRETFNFGKDEDSLFDLSEKAIYKEAANVAKDFFSKAIDERFTAKKDKVNHYVFSSAPWHKPYLKNVNMDDMPVDISDFELEMMFQKIKFENEQKARIAIKELTEKQAEVNSQEDVSNLESEVQGILSLVTESQKNDLAHYVCQRRKVIELFDELRRRLENGKPHLESEMHNLIFPMIKDDREIDYNENNLWLLDERFNFTQYIASDKVISKVDHKEPDLAIFYESGLFYRNGYNSITSPIAIVEFKRPKRTNYPMDENPIIQALQYAGKILDGKYELPDGLEPIEVDKNNTPVYIYIVADLTPKLKDFADYAGLCLGPDKQCYFGYNPKHNAYIEIKSFKKVIDDAKMRNQIFFEKLGIPLLKE